jgi:hypothetical protein
MINFYTYLHCKPNGDPFYVGKGFGYRSHKFAIRNHHHKNIVAKCGGKDNIDVLVFPCDSETHAFECEKNWISVLREAGYVLANQTDGGDGISGFNHSSETRLKQSLAAKGRKHTKETIAKISENNKAGTPEVRAKISVAHQGNHLSLEHREKIGAAQRGNPGIKHSDETRAKIVAARSKQTYSEETKAKLSASAKADWAKRKSILMQCSVQPERN